MDNKKLKIILGVVLLSIVLAVSFYVWTKSAPVISNDTLTLESYTHSLRDSSVMGSCVAAVKGDISFCDTLGSDHIEESGQIEECKSYYEKDVDLILMNRIVNGECNDLPESTFMNEELCGKIKSQNCEGLSGAQDIVCNVVTTQNIDLCNSLDGLEKEDCISGGKVYLSLKKGAMSFCNEEESTDLGRAGCIGVLNENCEEAIMTLAEKMFENEQNSA